MKQYTVYQHWHRRDRKLNSPVSILKQYIMKNFLTKITLGPGAFDGNLQHFKEEIIISIN